MEPLDRARSPQERTPSPSLESLVEFGVDTYGDVSASRGVLDSHARVLRNTVEQGELADQVGLTSFGLGEHHRDDFAISAPDVVAAAVAARTQRLRLTTAATVLGAEDPVRLMERFATLDALSNGRAEIVLGRGTYTEPFRLFGHSMEDYEDLFDDKLGLFMTLRNHHGRPIDWDGTHTQTLRGAVVYPAMERPLPTWIAVSGNPDSVIRAARYGLPVVFAVDSGPVSRFAAHADLHRRALLEFGQPQLPVAFQIPGHVAATDSEAEKEFIGPHLDALRRVGAERGLRPVGLGDVAAELARGCLAVGSPETVAYKIASGMYALGAVRCHLKIGTGTLSHAAQMRCIELYGTKVVPLVRDMLAELAEHRPHPAWPRADSAAATTPA